MPSVDEVLGPASPLAKRLAGYEHRDGQLAMARAVYAAFERDRHLFVEAGTGTGKTFAYLVPAVLSGRTVVISTATHALQEQIFEKDIPFVREILAEHGIPFRAALMKGLSNYLCKRRLAERLRSGERVDAELAAIERWSLETQTGDRTELTVLNEAAAGWRDVHSGTDTRIGASCKYYDECHVTRMRREAEQAQIIVVNHHLFFADLALKTGRTGAYGGAIPPYDAVVFDEAHQVESIATDFFGVRISSTRLDRLIKDGRRAIVGAKILDSTSMRVIDDIELTAHGFFKAWQSARGEEGRRLLAAREWTPPRRAAIGRLDVALQALVALALAADDDDAMAMIARRAADLRSDLGKIHASSEEKHWVADEDEDHQGHAAPDPDEEWERPSARGSSARGSSARGSSARPSSSELRAVSPTAPARLREEDLAGGPDGRSAPLQDVAGGNEVRARPKKSSRKRSRPPSQSDLFAATSAEATPEPDSAPAPDVEAAPTEPDPWDQRVPASRRAPASRGPSSGAPASLRHPDHALLMQKARTGFEGGVTWIDARDRSVSLGASPVDLAPVLRERLFERVGSVICTSATLATTTHAGPSFHFAKGRLGSHADAEELVVSSPFDFASRAAFYVADDLPEPGAPGFEHACAARARELADITGGGAFVLCTSNRAMRAIYNEIARQPGRHGPLFVQGEAPKHVLLEKFRAAGDAILVATMSFWEGVDVPGHALRLVVIDKIPFAVPTEPVVAARSAKIEAEGGNPFIQYSVPAAAITLKQGFGRLIRTRQDAGIVALLDRRAAKRGYGRALLDSLPPARRVRSLDDARDFWQSLD